MCEGGERKAVRRHVRMRAGVAKRGENARGKGGAAADAIEALRSRALEVRARQSYYPGSHA